MSRNCREKGISSMWESCHPWNSLGGFTLMGDISFVWMDIGSDSIGIHNEFCDSKLDAQWNHTENFKKIPVSCAL